MPLQPHLMARFRDGLADIGWCSCDNTTRLKSPRFVTRSQIRHRWFSFDFANNDVEFDFIMIIFNCRFTHSTFLKNDSLETQYHSLIKK